MELWQINRLKSNRFSFLHRSLHYTKVAITDFDTDSTCSSNMKFSVATGLASAINVSIKILTIVEEDSIERFFIFWNKILILWKRTEVSFFNHVDYENHISPWVEAWFFPSRSQSELFDFWQTFRLKNCLVSSLQLKPDAPKFPKGAIIFDLTRCSNSILPKFTCLICSITIPTDIFEVVTNQSNKK